MTPEHDTQIQPARCLNPRCRRILQAKASIAAGFGPVCRARMRAAAVAEAVKGFTADQADRARQLIADGGIIATTREGIYRAVASSGLETYLVSIAGVCNCKAALRTGRADRCYHVAAARVAFAATGKAA